MAVNICFIINLQNQELVLKSHKNLAFCKFYLAKMAYGFCALYCKMNPGSKSMPYTKNPAFSSPAGSQLLRSALFAQYFILEIGDGVVWYGEEA